MGQARTRVAVAVAAAASVWVAGAAAPAAAHGDGDARAIVRDVAVGPYTASAWQMADDESRTSTAEILVRFGAEGPGVDDVVVVSVEYPTHSVLQTSPSQTVDGAWQTTETVAPGDVFRVGVTTTSGTWWSKQIAVPRPFGGTALIRLVIVMTGFLCVGVITWLGFRAPRVWIRRAPAQTEPVLMGRATT